MFKKLTLEDKLKAERAEKMDLLRNQEQLEEAVLGLAQIISNYVSEEEPDDQIVL
jgi:cell division septum initiation protein DivIVA